MTQSSPNNESQLEPIYHKIQQLDKKLKKLEISSQKVIVTGSKKNFQPKPLFIDQEELVNLYNYLPNVLLEYITPVNITADTYRENTNNNVYLEYNLNGNYWVILTEYKSQKFYWLVLNANRRNNFHRLKDRIESLFIIQGDLDSYNYLLTKLAKVEILSSGLKWRLIKKGYLQIGQTSPTEKLINRLKKLKLENGKLPEDTKQLVEAIDSYYQKTLEIEKEQIELKNAVIQITEIIVNNHHKLTKTTNQLEQTIKTIEARIYKAIDDHQQINSANLTALEQSIDQKNQIISHKVSENYRDNQQLKDSYEKLNKSFKQEQKKIRNVKTNLGCLNFLMIICIVILALIFL